MSNPNRFSSLPLENYVTHVDTKSKFSAVFQPHTDCQIDVVYESALSSFVSHVHMKSHHKLHKEVMNKTVQTMSTIKFELIIGNY